MKEKKEPTIVDVLRRMKALLRKGWTQGTTARGKSGRNVSTDSRAAVSFCLMGARARAIWDVCGSNAAASVELWEEPRLLIEDCAGNTAEEFNDTEGRTKKEILAVVDCAIKKAATG